jgi:glycosyltransferase involved in cell wall biosynthesis
MPVAISLQNTVVIIPCYNHGTHLGALLDGVKQQLPSCNIVVVDDGSADNCTLTASSKGCHVLRHPENRGKGAALWTGMQWGLEHGSQWFLFLDADGQHPPEIIPAFWELAESTNSNFIMGNRLGDMSDMPIHRRLSNRITSWLLSRKIGRNIPDSQCGFRLMHRSCLKDFTPTTRHYETETEILLHAARNRARFASVTIPTVYRGQSSSIRNVRDTIRFLRLIIRHKKAT